MVSQRCSALWIGIGQLESEPPSVGTYTARITNAAGSGWSRPMTGDYPPVSGSPVIRSSSFSGGSFTVVFPSLLGRNYRVGYSPDLGTTPWAPLGTYPGTGAEMTRTFAASGSSGFYQVVEIAP